MDIRGKVPQEKAQWHSASETQTWPGSFKLDYGTPL